MLRTVGLVISASRPKGLGCIVTYAPFRWVLLLTAEYQTAERTSPQFPVPLSKTRSAFGECCRRRGPLLNVRSYIAFVPRSPPVSGARNSNSDNSRFSIFPENLSNNDSDSSRISTGELNAAQDAHCWPGDSDIDDRRGDEMSPSTPRNPGPRYLVRVGIG